MKEILNDPTFLKIRKVFSVLVPLFFMIYNGFIGFKLGLIYNISISIYYLLLMSVKSLLLISDNAFKLDDGKNRKKIYIISFIILLLINLALIAPSILLIKNQKNVNITSVISIIMATYTFYSVGLSIYNLIKYKNSENLLYKQLKLVVFMNAIVSMMTLQNTLINVNGEMDQSMKTLSSITTFFFIGMLIFLTIFTFCKNLRKSNSTNPNISKENHL
jgi:hypothetical protein